MIEVNWKSFSGDRNMKDLILASTSPRRKELMELLGYDFKVMASHVEEHVDFSMKPDEIVQNLARQKAEAVFNENRDAVVLGSDTVVVVDEQILGKPKDENEAREMMQLLRNRTHQVITGVAILSEERKDIFANTTTVHFSNITDEEIEEYIKTPEAYDKAGGYAIQGWAGRFVPTVEGNYFTIMGLPISEVYEKLKNYDI